MTMKTRQDFATDEEFFAYYDRQYELPEVPRFELLEAIKNEQQQRQEELNRKSKVLKEEQSKLGALKAKVNNFILSGAKESELDQIYDEIAKQETIVQRRESEYQTITQARDQSKFTQAELSQAFRKHKGEFEQSAINPQYEKLARLKQEYHEGVHELERQIIAFNDQAKEVDRHLDRLQKIHGGVSYGTSEISVKYDAIDIKLQRGVR
jgi:DNA repair ATPase RecN